MARLQAHPVIMTRPSALNAALALLLLAGCGLAESEFCDPDGPWTEAGEPEGEINGTCAPEGELYTDYYACEGVAGPCRGDADQGATAQVPEDPERLEDEDLEWVQDQLGACSCSCCHNVEGESAHIWAWDFEPVWTDSIESARLARVAAGSTDEDDYLGENNGFDRLVVTIPSTDGERLKAYLQRELDRRNR